MSAYRRISGFTLIELAMVIFIVGLLLSSLLSPLSTRLEQQERNETRSHMEEIRQVLYGFVLRNHQLPCPDCSVNTADCTGFTGNDGRQDVLTGGICATEIGNLPWADLGVRGADAWGNNFTYRVAGDFADSPNVTTMTRGCSATSLITAEVSFSLCSIGNITVNDDSGMLIAENIPAIIISHGRNRLDLVSPSPSENENINNDNIFVDRTYSNEDGNEFDDILVWISPHGLRNLSVQAALLP